MTAANKHRYDTDILDTLAQRVVVGDGAMGTQLQAADLTLDDFRGLEGCNEILNETRPDVLENIHRAYFEAGADAVETNTFGCNMSNLGDYDIADRIRDLSQRGTAIARRVADELTGSGSGPDRKRYVLGSMGPGTKLPTLGHTEYRLIRDAYTEAALGMLEAGADAILVETCQDLVQLKAAVLGSRRAMAAARPAHPGVRPRHRGDHRHHAAGQRDRRGADRRGAARRRHDRSELRDRARRDERAPALAVPPRPRSGVGDAQRRACRCWATAAPTTPCSPASWRKRWPASSRSSGSTLVGGCCGTTPEHIREVAAAVAWFNDGRPRSAVSAA